MPYNAELHTGCMSIQASNLSNIRTGKDVVHYIEKYPKFLYTGCYTISINIPKYLFVNDYPHHPRNLGENIRKYRMDSGLSIKQLAHIIGISEDTIINWEIRNIKPLKSNLSKLHSIFSL